MPKFEYMTITRNYGDDSEEVFINKINKLGRDDWEAVCKLSSILSNFEQILLKRIKNS